MQNELDDVKAELSHKKRALDDAKEVIRTEKEKQSQLEMEKFQCGYGQDTNRAYVIKSTAQALQKAQEDLKKKNTEIRDLKDALEEQEELVGEYKAELDQQTLDGQALEKEKDQVNKELDNTKSSLASARQELAKLTEKSETMSSTFSQNQTEEELDNTKSALAFAQQELAEMKEKFESMSLTFSQDQTNQELENTKYQLALARQELSEMKEKPEPTTLAFYDDMTSFRVESCAEYEATTEYEETMEITVTETEVACAQ